MNGAEHYDRYVVPFTLPYTEATVAAVSAGARTALDHGAGTGSVTRAILQRAPRSVVTALDPSVEMLDRLVASLGPHDRSRVEVVNGTVEDLPTTATFDVVTSQLALAFCPDIDHDLAELRTRTRAGGTLLTASLGSTEDLGAFTHYWDAARSAVPTLAPTSEYPHFRTADPTELSERLERAGWTVRDVARISSWRTLTADEWWDWVSAALPLRLNGGEYVEIEPAQRAKIRIAFDAQFLRLADGLPTVTLPMHGWLSVAHNRA